MLKQNNSSLSSYQRVYLIAGSFLSSIKTLIAIYILIVSYYLLGYFSSREGDYIEIVGLFLFIAFVITSPFLAYHIIKVIRLSRKLKEWNKEYLHSSYTVIFDTTLAHGNNIAEKILYLASFIFPDLKEDYYKSSLDSIETISYYFKKKILKKNIFQKSYNFKLADNYTLDLLYQTPAGYFIVKHFRESEVTVEDLKFLIRILNDKFKDKLHRHKKIYRIICVSKNYDEAFLDSLERIMTSELKSNLVIDLVVEEDIGFSVLWIG